MTEIRKTQSVNFNCILFRWNWQCSESKWMTSQVREEIELLVTGSFRRGVAISPTSRICYWRDPNRHQQSLLRSLQSSPRDIWVPFPQLCRMCTQDPTQNKCTNLKHLDTIWAQKVQRWKNVRRSLMLFTSKTLLFDNNWKFDLLGIFVFRSFLVLLESGFDGLDFISK